MKRCTLLWYEAYRACQEFFSILDTDDESVGNCNIIYPNCANCQKQFTEYYVHQRLLVAGCHSKRHHRCLLHKSLPNFRGPDLHGNISNSHYAFITDARYALTPPKCVWTRSTMAFSIPPMSNAIIFLSLCKRAQDQLWPECQTPSMLKNT